MRKIEFVPVRLTEIAEVFSIRIEDDSLSEFQKFLIMFRDAEDEFIKDDFFRIAEVINQISEQGALERFFRPEGKYKDRVWAIPLEIIGRDKKTHGTLRLYCIRISDKLLILGGGGLKVSEAYQEDPKLLESVQTLQEVDKVLRGFYESEDDLNNLTIYID